MQRKSPKVVSMRSARFTVRSSRIAVCLVISPSGLDTCFLKRVTTIRSVLCRKELLQPLDASVNVVSCSDVPATIGKDNTALAAELDKVKARITELELVEPVTVCRHKELLDEAKQR